MSPRSRAGAPARTKGHSFVIQKHAARRLHYDLRLEHDGVMKSWAVTRGPSLVPGEKRLAMHVEDHPIEYNSFEGTIPQGEYGGGTVLIWDRGQWHPDGDADKAFEKGHLVFSLDGEKLQGRWHLVRMHGRAGEKKQPWLLIKANDEQARSADDPDILEDMPLSVVSGRSIPEIAAGKGRKRVWHSNRSVQENVKAGATKGNTPARRRQRQQDCEQDCEQECGKAAAVGAQGQKRRREEQEQGGGSGVQGRCLAAGVRAAVARHLACKRAEWGGLGARDQVRRLPHPSAARSRKSASAYSQGTRLDQQVSQHCRSGGRSSRPHRLARRGDRHRGEWHRNFLRIAGGAQGRRARELHLLRLRSSPPRRA